MDILTVYEDNKYKNDFKKSYPYKFYLLYVLQIFMHSYKKLAIRSPFFLNGDLHLTYHNP
jgi:hypothetical protein